MSQIIATIPAEVRERVMQVANELYEQSGRQTFPTVDQVRRVARVDMNATSSIMKEWRRIQTAQAAPVAIHIPDAVVQANNQVLASLWSQAQELANESLRTAQAAWEIERQELDDMRQELASAYEAQADELEQAKAEIERIEIANREVQEQAANELLSIKEHLTQAIARADRAEAQVGEIEKRVDDLRGELTKKSEQLEKAAADTASAKEKAAELIGKLSAIQDQNAALLARLTPASDQ